MSNRIIEVQTDKPNSDPFTIKIGVIPATYPGLLSNTNFYNTLVAPEINDYLSRLPRSGGSPRLKVEFVIEGPSEDEFHLTPARHLEILQNMHESGIEYFIAVLESWYGQGCLDYIADKRILLVSPSSTATSLKYDNKLFRLAPADDLQAVILTTMLANYDQGIDSIVGLYREDSGGIEFRDAVNTLFEGEMKMIPYPPCIDPNDPACMPDNDFTAYLEQAETVAQNLPGNVGFLLLAFDENVSILQQAKAYNTLYGLPWFATGWTGKSEDILSDAAQEACHVSLISAFGAPPNSSKFNDLAHRFSQLGHGSAGFYTATAIDAAWLIIQAVLETSTLSNRANAEDAYAVFRDIASRYYGYSGWTLLNEHGDREAIDHEIWGFGPDENGQPSIIKFGSYEVTSGEIRWEHSTAPWEDSN